MTEVYPLKWSNSLEPKRQDRWIMQINGIDAFNMRTSGRPKVTSDEIEIPFINNTAYFKGKTKWDPIDVTLLDAISPAASKSVVEWLLILHDQKTGVDGYKAEYARNISLSLLSPLNTVVEKWKIHKSWPTNIDFGTLDMASAEPVEISMTLRYDWAELEEITTGE